MKSKCRITLRFASSLAKSIINIVLKYSKKRNIYVKKYFNDKTWNFSISSKKKIVLKIFIPKYDTLLYHDSSRNRRGYIITRFRI